MGIARDVGIIDCYRYYNGNPYRNAYPIVVQFKARREKEQILWRSKDKLRKQNIIVTDDSTSRMEQEKAGKMQLSPSKAAAAKTKPKQVPEIPPEQALFADFF